MPYEWTPESIAKLKELWQSGVSARTIAQKMGGAVTRNAVIGKANRLGISVSSDAKPRKKLVKKIDATLDAPTRKKCQWPFGDPADKNFHFCEKPTFEARPYCKEHCMLAYRRIVAPKHIAVRIAKEA